jgi:hypothetical protein
MPKEKTIQTDFILNSLKRALRPIPFWMGYKREKYWKHAVPEAAIVAELRETLLSSIGRDLYVECEVSYSKFDLRSTTKKRNGRPQQADLVISSKSPGFPKKYHAVIEIKLGNTLGILKEDTRKLRQIRIPANRLMGKYVLLVTEAGKPSFGITVKGNASRRQLKIDRRNIKVRGVFRSLGFLSSSEKRSRPRRKRHSQHWVMLIEVG